MVDSRGTSPLSEKSVSSKMPSSGYSLERWTQSFVRSILRIALVLGLILFVVSFSDTTPVLLILYAASYLALLLATFLPITYRAKGIVFLVLLFTLGVSGLLENGLRGDSRVFLVAFSAIATILYGQRVLVATLIINAVAIIVIGILVLLGQLTLINAAEVPPGDIVVWITGLINTLIVALLIGAGVTQLQRGFRQSILSVQNMVDALSHERAMLEGRVLERTTELEESNKHNARRALQFQAIDRVARAITSIRSLNDLLPEITRLISEQFDYYHVGIFLNDDASQYTVLSASNSEGGIKMLERKHRLKVGEQGIVGYAAGTGKPRIAIDVGEDAVFFDNPDLPETRSEMAIPLRAGDQIMGVLDVQSRDEVAFSEEDIEVLSTLGEQVGLAIENARLFDMTSRSLAEAESIYRLQLQQSWKRLASEQTAAGYRYTLTGVTPLENPLVPSSAEAGQPGLQLVVPINLRGENIGSLIIQSASARVWSEDELDLINAIADRVAISAENARLFEETTRRADRERAVTDITSKIRATTDPDAMITSAIEELKSVLGATTVRVRPYAPAQAMEHQGNMTKKNPKKSKKRPD
ncbi:MAG: GAF domain-containing protein [Chloroflexota bacterium]